MKSKLTLRRLQKSDREQFYLALNDRWESDFHFALLFESFASKSFEKYVSIIPKFSTDNFFEREYVPMTLLFAFNELGDLVGRSSIRHYLNSSLEVVGGHIGYGVVPRFRRRGYSKLILQSSLTYIRENLSDLSKVLVTCSEDNIGSIRTIESCKGILENTILVDGIKKRRYWIEI